jgi:hypothetical protein
MEFLYEWCAQTSEVVQELRGTNQMLVDKVIILEGMLADKSVPPT